MARLPRVVVADVAHHVTQRGNARQVIIASDIDRTIYLELLREYAEAESDFSRSQRDPPSRMSVIPALKRWAIGRCPCGTGTSASSTLYL